MLKLPKNNFVLLETNKADRDNKISCLFKDPVKIISCDDLNRVERALKNVDEYVEKGFYAAGFVSYEAGCAFESGFPGTTSKKGRVPLVWFGIYKRPVPVKKRAAPGRAGAYSVTDLRPNVRLAEYKKSIGSIKRSIRRGDTYQVNYTFKYNFGFSGSPRALYENLKEKQKTSYSAFIKAGNLSVLSLSPELFFRKKGRLIETKPMKGTMSRGRNFEEDLKKAKELRNSPKNRSENIMIVDMLRNDLSRICLPKSVDTSGLFEVEKYGTLFQMVSTVKGKLEKGETHAEIFKNIFPPGSVTGAPKIKTMQIIKTLEKEPRGVYTGAIGFISPAGRAVFNVAIRTVVIDPKNERGEMGIGSGIVIDSDASQEYAECLLKARFLVEPRFHIFESMLYLKKGGFRLLDHHVERLERSAEYFGFAFNRKSFLRALRGGVSKLKGRSKYKIKACLFADGKMKVHANTAGSINSGRVIFSKLRTDPKDPFLYHKTSERKIYSRELDKYTKMGYADVLFTNEKGEVTEGARTNIFIVKNNRFYTPPVSSGLLPGVFRRDFMKKRPVIEKVLYPEDVLTADKVYIGNSVRGLLEVSFKDHGK